MTMEDFRPNVDPREARIKGVLDLFLRSLSVVFLLLGLKHWAIILGAFPQLGWNFEQMGIEWQLVTINLGVADLVAGVGLWMLVAWGTVIWVYAAVFEIIIHTVFQSSFGDNYPLALFHIATLLVYGALWIAENRVRRRG